MHYSATCNLKKYCVDARISSVFNGQCTTLRNSTKDARGRIRDLHFEMRFKLHIYQGQAQFFIDYL